MPCKEHGVCAEALDANARQELPKQGIFVLSQQEDMCIQVPPTRKEL